MHETIKLIIIFEWLGLEHNSIIGKISVVKRIITTLSCGIRETRD